MTCKCGHSFAEHCGPSRAVECSVVGCACQGFDDAAAPAPAGLPHPPCCYCEKDAVSGLAIEHSGLAFCSVACLWDAAFCDGFDTALDKVRAKKFEPIGDVLDALELEIINTTPRREPARKGSRS